MRTDCCLPRSNVKIGFKKRSIGIFLLVTFLAACPYMQIYILEAQISSQTTLHKEKGRQEKQISQNYFSAPSYLQEKVFLLRPVSQTNSSLLLTGTPSLPFPPSRIALFRSPSSRLLFRRCLQIHCQVDQTALNWKGFTTHWLYHTKRHGSRERSGVHRCAKPTRVHGQERLR